MRARGETPWKPPLSPSSNLVLGKVDRVMMRVYSLENEKAIFLIGQVLDYPQTIPYCSGYHPN